MTCRAAAQGGSFSGRAESILGVGFACDLCRRVLQQSGGLELSWHEQDDALAYLCAACWQLSLEYDPARNPGHLHPSGGFAGWATYRLKQRYVDWRRQQHGRTRWTFGNGEVYERMRPQILSLDADDGDGGLGATLTARAGDPAHDRDPDLRRLVEGDDSQRARDLQTLGLQSPR